MTGFLIVIHTIVSLLLVAVVLMQASQGGGLSGTFGGNAASSVLGGQNAGNVLSKITTWLATIFFNPGRGDQYAHRPIRYWIDVPGETGR